MYGNDVARLRHKHAIRVAQLAALNRNLRTGNEFGDGDRPDATCPLGK
jgi:hypothetical protein